MLRAKVMVVDDDSVYREVIAVTLERAGFEVHPVGCGEEAVASISTILPAVVLLDQEMPQMNGIETARAFRALPGIPDIPIIMLTGASDADFVRQARGAGVRDFILKPADRATIVGTIRSLITG